KMYAHINLNMRSARKPTIFIAQNVTTHLLYTIKNRSYDAFHGLSLIVQFIPAVGIIAFAAWGLGPLLLLEPVILHSSTKPTCQATASGFCSFIVYIFGICILLIEQLTRQLEDQENVTDPVARLRIQSSALRSGALLQNLDTFLLEASYKYMSTTTDPAADGGFSNREAGIRNLSQPRGSPDVPVVPIRISTLPPELASSEPICSSVSVVYPVLARAQHADSSNVSGSHARSAENRPPEASEIHVVEPMDLQALRRNMIEAPLQAGQMVRHLFLWGSASCFFTYTVCHHSLE
nr:mechanosensitive ion channel protein 2, chloroplastic-like isoform X1 [Tanacetum cinerariifolium]